MNESNEELASALEELASLLAARKVDRFRVRAYERVATMIRSLPVPVAGMSAEEVRRLEGVGDALAAVIAQYLAAGTIDRLEELRAEEPAGMGELLRLPLIGIRDARTLAGEHGVAGVAALRSLLDTAAAADRLGDRLAARARESLRRLDNVEHGLPLTLARRASAVLAAGFGEVELVDDVHEAGAVRRGCDTVDRFGLVLQTADVVAAGAAVREHPSVLEVLADEAAAPTLLTTGGRLVDLQITTAENLGAALLLGTGSPAHLAELRAFGGEQLALEGVRRGAVIAPAPSEESAYAVLGLPVIAPELREGTGEVGAAAAGRLPQLVTRDDLLGDLHVHTDWSRDGKATLAEMVEAAIAAGHRYVALTDHAENLTINGMQREKVLARRDAIAEARDRYRQIEILDAAELNIGLDGSLDYDLDFLCAFDLTVASIHSHMDRPVAVQTERILAAVAHPAVDVIGHPTGRILGHRPGYAIELKAIAQAAAETGTALEVNGSPRRLDLSAPMVRAARAAGARLSLSSDAHSTAELRSLDGAVTVARRGWSPPSDILNARSAPDLKRIVAAKRAAG